MHYYRIAVHATRPAAVPMSPKSLSPRELEILQLLCQGIDSNADLAAELMLSPFTIRYHMKGLLNKLSASSRAQLVARGYSSGLVG